MTDRELKTDINLILIGLAAVAFMYFLASSEWYQHYRWMQDCGQRYTQSQCQEMWRMAND